MSDTEYTTTVELPDRAGEFLVTVYGERTPYRPQTMWEPAEGGFEVLCCTLHAGPSLGETMNPICLDFGAALRVLGPRAVARIEVDAAEDADIAARGDEADRRYDEWRERFIDGGEFDIGGDA